MSRKPKPPIKVSLRLPAELVRRARDTFPGRTVSDSIREALSDAVSACNDIGPHGERCVLHPVHVGITPHMSWHARRWGDDGGAATEE